MADKAPEHDTLAEIKSLVLDIAKGQKALTERVDKIQREAGRLLRPQTPESVLADANAFKDIDAKLARSGKPASDQVYEASGGRHAGTTQFRINDIVRFREDSERGQVFRSSLQQKGLLKSEDPMPPAIVLKEFGVIAGRSHVQIRTFNPQRKTEGDLVIAEDDLEYAPRG